MAYELRQNAVRADRRKALTNSQWSFSSLMHLFCTCTWSAMHGTLPDVKNTC